MSTTVGPLLDVRDLSTWLETDRGTLRAVDHVSFSLERGETFALVGESGCGKSMTALSLMRLLPDAARIAGGKVLLEGEDLLARSESAMRELRGASMGIIFQEPGTSLNPVLSVGDQLTEVLERHTELRGEAVRTRARELLEQVGIPDTVRRLAEYPFQLSGGMKQRVMIAIALSCHPKLLIADEPTTALDVTIQAQVLDLLRRLQQETHMALLLITHDLGVVSEMAHRVAVMYAGEIVETAPRSRFFRAPAHPYSRKLFEALPNASGRGRPLAVIPGTVPALTASFAGCRFASRCEHAWQRCHTEVPAAVDLGEGQAVRCHLYAADRLRVEGPAATPIGTPHLVKPDTPSPADKVRPLLQVEGLKVHFPIRRGVLKRVVGYVKAVDGVDLTIGSHRTLALVGESGCGKTTVGRGVLKLLPLTAGRVVLDGQDLAALSPSQLRVRRKDIQIIFQDPYASLNPRMRILDLVEEGMAALGIGGSSGERQDRVDQLLGQVGLSPEMKYRYPHEFSGGQRQRIAIARALAVEPKLIVCDEPTSALDVSVQAQILNLLKDLQTRLGLAYLFITHNISVVEFLAHDVAVMYLGRIVERGPVEAVLSKPLHPYTRALLSAVPVIEGGKKTEIIRLQGELPSPVRPPQGCHFHPRCPATMAQCRHSYPSASRQPSGQLVHCHLYPPS
ncbi:MAG TPA: ABC transporter ATP-binding protein [Burkholderiales bacterium]|nr:ABC transporter ATP-binding protein [Burkholderiales bacterium]